MSPDQAVGCFHLLLYCCWHIMLQHHICVLALEVYEEGVCMCVGSHKFITYSLEITVKQ